MRLILVRTEEPVLTTLTAIRACVFQVIPATTAKRVTFYCFECT